MTFNSDRQKGNYSHASCHAPGLDRLAVSRKDQGQTLIALAVDVVIHAASNNCSNNCKHYTLAAQS